MIFPDISADKWIKIHPELEIEQDFCDECGLKRLTTIPFIEQNWIGLKAPPCSCNEAGDFEIRISRNEKTTLNYQTLLM